MKKRCLPIVFLAAFFAFRAVAWGPTGHRVVAEIAQRHLKPAARERVARLLGGYSLAEVANWADDLRSDPRFDKYKRLHFATVPDGVKSYRDAKKDPCGDLVAAIDALSAFLKTGSRDDLFAVKAFTDKSDGVAKGACNPQETEPISAETALQLLVHFVGDLHEPLHIGGTDQGGNLVKVSWMNRWQSNLHSIWDDEMVDFERLDYPAYSSFLNHASEAEVARWQKGDTIAWADENVAMRSKLYLFPDDQRPFATGQPVTPAHLVSYGYIGAQRERMRQQLLKGGLRLARVLNTIFE
ncbi:MAG TPA: S1/P1 nuclease [Bryobacteraceae bacterium]|nr:S1/P1 nuclease [Bryobacteraceae bacterium]